MLGRHAIIDPRAAGLFRVPATLWNRFGWAGVDLFFVLSGFLVGGLLFKELSTTGRLDVKRFIIRRGFKIWPSYYLFLAVLCIWTLCHEKATTAATLHAVLPGLLHFQNFTMTGEQSWSLAIEEHFYLLLPLTLLFLLRWSRLRDVSAIPGIAVSVMVCCLAYRSVVGAYHPNNFALLYYPTQSRIDSLFCGVLLAYFYYFRPAFFATLGRYARILFIPALILLLPFSVLLIEQKPFVMTQGFTIVYLCFGCILAAEMDRSVPSIGRDKFYAHPFVRFIAWIGTYSYAIYLWHLYIAILLKEWWPHSFLRSFNPTAIWVCTMLVYFSITMVVSVALSKLIEFPALRIRDRLFPARASAVKS